MNRWLFFTWLYPPAPGGVEEIVRATARGLASRGREVMVVTAATPTVAAGDREEEGVRVVRLDGLHPAASSPPRLDQLAAVAAEFGPDVIHAHMLTYPWMPERSAAVIEALRKSGAPLLDQAHGGDPAQDPASCVRLMSAVDGVICDSSFICAELERLVDEVEPDWPLPPLHVAHPVPGAPELFVPDPGHRAETREELGFAPEDLVAFFPSRFFDVDGRLSERKRPEVAIDAFIAWASEEPRARFLAVGSPGFWTPESETRSREELGERLIRGGVLERTKMLNRRVSRAEMAALYRAADLTIVPSIEGFGLVYLESMACGTPLVAIDRGAVREVVGDGAEIVAADEPLAPRLARALGELGRDEGRREALAVAGLARAARTFRPGRWLDDVESIVLLVSET